MIAHANGETRHRPKILVTPPEFQKIWTELHRFGPLLQLGARMMFDTGLRVGEVQQLLWNDCVALATPAARLELSKERVKTGYARSVPLPPFLHLELLQAQQLLPPELMPADRSHRRVLVSTKGTGVGVRWIEKCLTHASKAALGYNVNPHALRHSFADRLLKHSNLRVVQLALGHVSLNSTQIYTHPQMNEIAEAITAAATAATPPTDPNK